MDSTTTKIYKDSLAKLKALIAKESEEMSQAKMLEKIISFYEQHGEQLMEEKNDQVEEVAEEVEKVEPVLTPAQQHIQLAYDQLKAEQKVNREFKLISSNDLQKKVVEQGFKSISLQTINNFFRRFPRMRQTHTDLTLEVINFLLDDPLYTTQINKAVVSDLIKARKSTIYKAYDSLVNTPTTKGSLKGRITAYNHEFLLEHLDPTPLREQGADY
jgi:hypothetical protein